MDTELNVTDDIINVTEKEREGARILVIGIGGGGNNALNRMINQNVINVEYIAINTDIQDLNRNLAPTKYALGSKKKLANNDKRGLGAGGDPEIAEQYAEECSDDLERLIEGSNMVFITAGMGGGTGTGAAPVVAKLAKGKGILTVAVVTKPFRFEGAKRRNRAEKGIEKLKDNVDTLFVIPNDKLKDVFTGTNIPDASIQNAFYKADEVLMQCITGITNIIRNNNTLINLDFADVEALMKDKGYGHVGIGRGEGDNKLSKALEAAKSSPLLETSIAGAKTVMINFSGDSSLTFEEVSQQMEALEAELDDEDLNLYMGIVNDDTLKGAVTVTLVATNLAEKDENQGNSGNAGGFNPNNGGFQNNSSDIKIMNPSYQPQQQYRAPQYNNPQPQYNNQQQYSNQQQFNNQQQYNNPQQQYNYQQQYNNNNMQQRNNNMQQYNMNQQQANRQQPKEYRTQEQPMQKQQQNQQGFTPIPNNNDMQNGGNPQSKKGYDVPDFLKRFKK